MLYTPHAITGATIAYIYPNPLVAIPLAIASHLFFDVIPHSNPNPIKASGATKILILFEIFIGNIALFLFSKFLSGNNTNLLLIMIASGVAANLPDILTGPYAMLKKDILYSKEIAEFQKLIQNHVSAIFGYSLQIVFLVVLIVIFLDNSSNTF